MVSVSFVTGLVIGASLSLVGLLTSAAGNTRIARVDFADGLAGGPDMWRVVGVGVGDLLNLRAQPSARAAIVARVGNGTQLRNLGCRMTGGTRWCRVEGNGGVTGWAAGRYLRE